MPGLTQALFLIVYIKMNVLVTGANGQLGTMFKKFAEGKVNNFTPFFTDREELDIRDLDAINRFVDDNNIELILNCAAYTNVDNAESDPKTATDINAKACYNLASAMKRVNGYLISISTDYVFDGSSNKPYEEFDLCMPKNVYGMSKLAGEALILTSGCHYIILRTAWLYSSVGKNFVKTMFNKMKNSTNKETIKVVCDQIGCPTSAYDLAIFLYNIINNKRYINKDGIYHFVNKGETTWYNLTCEIARLIDYKGEIVSCNSDEYPTQAKRPNYSVLCCDKLASTFGYYIRHWTIALKDTVNELLKEE